MDINKYQLETRKTNIMGNNLDYFMVALGGETGELLNHYKKIMRGDKDLTLSEIVKLRQELGGIAWYWARVLDTLGCEASECLQENLGILEDRIKRNVVKGDGDDR